MIIKDAATIVLLRDGANGLEVFVVERHAKSGFMGGAIVFPGGKVDESDGSEAWEPLVTHPRDPAASRTHAETSFARDAIHARALAIAAARETLEEAAILITDSASLSDDELLGLRTKAQTDPNAVRAFLQARSVRLDLASLHPFARWITPEAESRRFDARFFFALAPKGQSGAHDAHETVSSFWATPSEVLRRFDAGEVRLMPPTHRTLALLEACADTASALAFAATTSLDPICPKLAPHVDAKGETVALTLPGDPAHDVREVRVPGPSRYVLRQDRWLPEDAPR